MDSILSLYAFGPTSGIVLEMGAGISTIVPIYEGQVQQQAIYKLNIAGNDLDNYMRKLESQKGIQMSIEDAREVKEKVCYIAYDFYDEMMQNVQKNITLSNGHNYQINENSFKVPEALFNPSILGLNSNGLDVIINDSIKKCDVDIRQELYGNIIVSGGGSMFPEIEDRLMRRIMTFAPPSIKVKIIALPDRDQQVWTGGSFFVNFSILPEMWITAEEYKNN